MNDASRLRIAMEHDPSLGMPSRHTARHQPLSEQALLHGERSPAPPASPRDVLELLAALATLPFPTSSTWGQLHILGLVLGLCVWLPLLLIPALLPDLGEGVLSALVLLGIAGSLIIARKLL